MTYHIIELIVGYGLTGGLPAYWMMGLYFRLTRTQLRKPPPEPVVIQPLPLPPAQFPLLDLNAPFTRDEVLAAYRHRAKQFHPDLGGWAAAFRDLVAEREHALKMATVP
jgi:hypothetical protein